MHQISAFIFDLDGIIVDTTHYHYLSWKILTESIGYHFLENENELLKGANRLTSLNIILKLAGLSYSEGEKKILCDQKNEIYLDLIRNMSLQDTMPGVINFIQASREKGLTIGLASSSKNAKTTITRLGLNYLFDFQLDANDVSRGKPFPDTYVKVSQALQLAPLSCIVFEDATHGVIAAKKAGMWVVGMGNPAQLEDADLIIPSFIDLDPDTITGYFSNQENQLIRNDLRGNS